MLLPTDLKAYLLENKVKPSIPVPIILAKPTKYRYGQSFGEDFQWEGKSFYGQWGMKGHNGIDYIAPENSDVIAPCKLHVSNYVKDDTYGNTLWAYSESWDYEHTKYRLEFVFAHINSAVITNQTVMRGVTIAKSGNSGYPITSTGPHLHVGVRIQYQVQNGDWFIENFNNGFRGYFNQYLITQDMFTLKKESNSVDVYAIDEVNKTKHRICNEYTLKIGKESGLFEGEIESLPTLSSYKKGVEMMFTPQD